MSKPVGRSRKDQSSSPKADGSPSDRAASGSGCLNRIHSQYQHLSNNDRRIAKLVLEEPNSFVLASTSEVAERCSTSEAAVSRFAHKLGYSGFPEFKIQLAQDLINAGKAIHEDISPEEPLDSVKQKLTAATIQALQDSLAVLESSALERAVEMLAGARQIAFIGVGGSGVLALDAAHNFMRTGKVSRAFHDSHEQAMFASLCQEGDVVVFISHSGATRDVLEAASLARARGAGTIGITHLGKPPLRNLVDVCLFTSARETLYRPESLSSRFATMVILDILFIGVGQRINEEMVENLRSIRSALQTRRS